MSLQEQLSELKAKNIASHPEEQVAVLLDETEKLCKSGLVEAAPKTGDSLKDFTLPNQLGEKRSLASLREHGPVVVTFYRGGWCPYCNLELRAYQKVLQDIKAAGATLVAITPELPDASLSTSEKNELEFEVLTDVNSDYARELGLVFTLPEKLRPIYEGFGIELEKHNGQEHGRIDVLFVNAGVAPFEPFAETDEASFDQVFDINVKGLFFTLQKASPLMNAGASVILTASVVHKSGFPGASAYAASKAAVRSIGQTAAAELASRGIRVNLLSPGPIETPIYGKTGLPQEAIEGMGEKMASSVPLGRFGTPDEMADVALFLASDESSYFTGADIQADGGYSQTVS